jgi:Flp pilus assembly protein TadD
MTLHRHTIGTCTTLLGAVLLGGGAWQDVEAQRDSAARVPLRFAWPIGLRGRIDLHTTRVELKKGVLDTTEQRMSTRFTVERHPEGRLVAFSDFRVATDSGNAALDVVSRADPQSLPGLVVDGNGVLQRLERFEPFVESVRRSLAPAIDSLVGRSPGAVQLLDRMLHPDVLLRQISDDWALAVTFWSNEDLVPGTVYEYADSAANAVTPDVTVGVQYEFALEKRAACQLGRADSTCVALIVISEPSPAAMKASASGLIGQFLGGRDTRWKMDSLSAMNRVYVVTEPATLVPHRVIVEQVIRGLMRGPVDSTLTLLRYSKRFYHLSYDREPSALYRAAAVGDDRAVAALLRSGASADSANLDEETPLFAAARGGYTAVVRRLIAGGADARRAYALARQRGAVDAMRALRPHARGESSPGSLRSALAQYEQGDVAGAIPLLADAAIAERRPGDAHAWLALALHRVGRPTDARALAHAVLAVDACSSLAHTTVAESHGAWRPAWPSSKTDSVERHLTRAVACDSTNFRAWMALTTHRARRGDSEDDAPIVGRMPAGVLTRAVRSLARWTLDAVPPNAIVVVSTPIEYFAMRAVQVAESRRGDAVVLRGDLMELPEYQRVASRRASSPVAATARGWYELRRDGKVARPVVFTLTLEADSTIYPFVAPSGPFITVRSDTAEKLRLPLPATVLPFFARAPVADLVATPSSTAMHGDEPAPSFVGIAVRGAVLYLMAMDEEYIDLDRSQLAAVDSLVEWTLRHAEKVDSSWAADITRALASPYIGKTAALARLNDWPAAHGAAERAARLDPTHAGAWSWIGYLALLMGRFDAADSAMRRAQALRPTLSTELNIATIARFRGNLDTALVWLRFAERSATGDRLTDTRYMYTLWHFSYLPVTRGDTITIRKSGRLQTTDEKLSFLRYGLAIVLAMRGDVAGANRELAVARRLGSSRDIRCFMASNMDSARSFGPSTPTADRWLQREAATLRAGVSCP